MSKYLFSPLAAQDLEAIGDYIAQDNPHRAITFVVELRTQCDRIAASPNAYRSRIELGENIRSSAYGNYVIFFQDAPNGLCILRILHGAMDAGSRFPKE